ncbi:MAG: TlpA family protein disulfide reductase [Gemmatimonadetes bacterium]|nr:TlpA family protein disulfide reductase [Gemmatimonadota bacterium]MBK7716501.1 TlpA family protein disulfide reductase [Gemmatimonadota bacterium]MBK7784118.1 TlpA family protein disulfide reductase [Gemmatimonadota bacterium]MBK9067835.1 TlpA family protein disulfide reductase [Gemmatimonadota bacterium]
MLSLLALLLATPDVTGPWRATLDLAGGPLEFGLVLTSTTAGLGGELCNAGSCTPFSAVRWDGDSLVLELGDYAASMAVVPRGDSLVGRYHNVGRRGPRTIPLRASRGRWTGTAGGAALLGRWDAWFQSGFEQTPRVFEIRNGPQGLEGAVISNSGDYGLFAGRATGDSLALGHFDGSFVYLLTGRLDGDTLRGSFHAGLRTRTAFVATRATGRPHLTPPTAVTRADSSAPLAFRFPDVDGRMVSSSDARFQGKVVLVDLFGTWCPTCHDAAPALVGLYQRFRERGLEVVGIAFEVTGDSAQDAPLVRRYREKFGIPFPLLLGGVSEVEAVSAAFPQLEGFTAYPTTLFVGRDGRIRRIHAGFYGPATGAAHEALVAEFTREVERLLAEPAPR